MYRQVIRPENKEDLIVHIPDEFLGKKVSIEVNEMKSIKKNKKDRAKALKKAFDFFNSISVDMSNFKFNRDEANER